MKNNKKTKIISIISMVFIIIVGIIIYNVLSDENKITSAEKRWITDNSAKVQNINVLNNENIFGNEGVGVFYTFIEDFEKEYSLDLNPVTFNNGESSDGVGLSVVNEINDNQYEFYNDHYVLVSKEYELINEERNINGKKIGLLNSNLSYVSDYLTNVSNLVFAEYDSKDALLDAFSKQKDINYIIVPLIEYMDVILKNNYSIVYHFSDIERHYVLNTSDDYFSSVLRKFLNVWKENNLSKSIDEQELKLFLNELNISQTELDAMVSIDYQYGFINNSPYEVLISGNYGGITAVYLKYFSDFSGVEIDFNKYSSLKKFNNDIEDKDIDLYFDYFNTSNEYNAIKSNIPIKFDVVADTSDFKVVNSLKALSDVEVYVQKDSVLESFLKQYGYLKLNTYEDNSDLKKLARKHEIIIMDNNAYEYYSTNILSNYSLRFSDYANKEYVFKTKYDNAFNKLFGAYISTLDHKTLVYKGVENHNQTVESGTVLGTIAKYLIIVIIIVGLILMYLYYKSKKIKIAKKIKKEDKMKFIDQLTSLKNRNYLNENITNWNNNNIYPQATLIVDINDLQKINDTLGYEQGDEIIKSVANILIRTQIDNTDIMRTDGNEFLVYMIGYSQKQVTNYLHKLNKEFNKLDYEYGVALGYSMINDNAKTIEDAINEAVEEMRSQKKLTKESKDEEKN
ncbi:MAG: GGDEF domain-containing protein [Bacilli bacterium]|nr:GGDEF domain-containing protein [Bacilli bacterium]